MIPAVSFFYFSSLLSTHNDTWDTFWSGKRALFYCFQWDLADLRISWLSRRLRRYEAVSTCTHSHLLCRPFDCAQWSQRSPAPSRTWAPSCPQSWNCRLWRRQIRLSRMIRRTVTTLQATSSVWVFTSWSGCCGAAMSSECRGNSGLWWFVSLCGVAVTPGEDEFK